MDEPMQDHAPAAPECTPAVWRRALLERLERGVGRSLVDADVRCLAWNESARTLTVEGPPLLTELRARGAISNVFRSRLLRQ
jgi:hypothetical protein